MAAILPTRSGGDIRDSGPIRCRPRREQNEPGVKTMASLVVGHFGAGILPQESTKTRQRRFMNMRSANTSRKRKMCNSICM